MDPDSRYKRNRIDIGRDIEEWCHNATPRVTQEKLAEILKISPKTVSRIWNGNAPIKPEYVPILSELMDKPPQYFIEGYSEEVSGRQESSIQIIIELKNNMSAVRKESNERIARVIEKLGKIENDDVYALVATRIENLYSEMITTQELIENKKNV